MKNHAFFAKTTSRNTYLASGDNKNGCYVSLFAIFQTSPIVNLSKNNICTATFIVSFSTNKFICSQFALTSICFAA